VILEVVMGYREENAILEENTKRLAALKERFGDELLKDVSLGESSAKGALYGAIKLKNKTLLKELEKWTSVIRKAKHGSPLEKAGAKLPAKLIRTKEHITAEVVKIQQALDEAKFEFDNAKPDELAEKAFAYHQALMTFNKALAYATECQELKGNESLNGYISKKVGVFNHNYVEGFDGVLQQHAQVQLSDTTPPPSPTRDEPVKPEKPTLSSSEKLDDLEKSFGGGLLKDYGKGSDSKALPYNTTKLENKTRLNDLADMQSILYKAKHGRKRDKLTAKPKALLINDDNISAEVVKIQKALDEAQSAFESANTDDPKLDEKAFAYHQALKTYEQALDLASKCYTDKYGEVSTYITKKVETLDVNYVDKFKGQLEEHSRIALESEKPAAGKISLKNRIDNMAENYEKDYDKSHGSGVFRKFKDIFQNKDRAAEIKFLQQVSDNPKCTDEMRLHAISLVEDKIGNTETFGQGSKLRQRLHKLTEKASVNDVDYDNKKDLKAFCERNGIKPPEKLGKYLTEHKNDYTTDHLKDVSNR
jgi:hypothetical protein